MRSELRKGLDVLTLYSRYEKFSKKIPTTHYMFFADSRHGKTLSEESFVEEMFLHGQNVIVPTEKFKHRLEYAMAMFEPVARYHNYYLKQQGKPRRKMPVKIHALFCNNINVQKGKFNYQWWKKKIFPFDFFTIDVKNDVNQNLWSMLFVAPPNSWAIKAVLAAQERLKPNEGVLELIRIATELIEKNIEQGTQNTIKEIESVLGDVAKMGILMPENCEFNLNPKKILLDRKYHLFHYGFLPEKSKKYEYFAVNCVIDKLISAYEDLKKMPKYSNRLYPVTWVYQEMNVFAPDKTKEIYPNISTDMFEERLKQMGSLGMSSVSDGQNIRRTAEGYRESVPVHFYGRLQNNDLEWLGKIGWGKSKRDRLANLPKGHFMMRDQKEYVSLFPGHRHCEEGEDFMAIFAQTHPELLKTHEQIYDYINKMIDEEKERINEYRKEIMMKKQKKEIEKEIKKATGNVKDVEEKEMLKKALQEKEEELKDKKLIEAYLKSRLNPDWRNHTSSDKPLSWVKLGEELGVSDHSAKKYAMEGKKLFEERL